jgi:hypothetical protein
VSPSADIWSLGVILHELISGDVPFTGSTFPEVLVQVMSDAPARLRSLRAEVPEGLEAVVLRCLEKDPADRYSSVAALGVALSPYASPRTLGLQARLRTSATHPPVAPLAALPLIIRETEVIRIQEVGAATAPTAPAPPPPAGVLPAFIAVPGEHSASKTNTAWGEQVATGSERPGGAGVLVVGGLLGVVALSALRSPSEPSSSGPVPAALPASVALPAASSPASDAPARPREPQIRPALDVPAVPAVAATTDETQPAAAADPLVPPSSATPTSPAADEHTVIASPTATTAGHGRVVLSKDLATSRGTSRSSGKTARARALAPPPKPVTNAPARPAAKPVAKAASASASTPTRAKPLSIDFK